MCTTVPPAKSKAPNSRSQPPTPHTQCATTSYANVAHKKMNTTYDLNFIRSTIAPEMSAGVMTANIAWYIMNA